MTAVTGYFLLGTWIAMFWAAFKVVQEVRGAVRDRRRTLRARILAK